MVVLDKDMLNIQSILEFFLKTMSLQFSVSRAFYKHTVKFQEKDTDIWIQIEVIIP